MSSLIRGFTHIVTFSLVDPGLLVARVNSSQDRSGTEVLPPKISRLREVLLAGIDFPGDKHQQSVRVQISLDLSELCDQYDSVLSSILVENAPLRKRVITVRPRAPYSEEIKEQKGLLS